MDGRQLSEWREELAREIARTLIGGRDKHWRCPAELKRQAISFAKIRREQGVPYADIARELGLVESTVVRWVGGGKKRRRSEPEVEVAEGFRSVAIVATEQELAQAQTPEPAPSQLQLITPQGYRIEGLDLDALAYLLGVLR